MKHYYVITGNEFGLDIRTKKNFKPDNIDGAILHYNEVKDDDFGTLLMSVDDNGVERVEKYNIEK